MSSHFRLLFAVLVLRHRIRYATHEVTSLEKVIKANDAQPFSLGLSHREVCCQKVVDRYDSAMNLPLPRIAR